MAALDQLKQDPELYEYLLKRVGKAHLRQRIGVETEHQADRFGQGRNFFHIENWRTAAPIIRSLLWITGLTARGEANTMDFRLRRHDVVLPHLPESFHDFTLLQLSDLHLDALPSFPDRLAEFIADLDYDVCVMTGDYRFLTYGCHQGALAGLERLRRSIDREIYAILGNHDTILMTPAMDDMGIRLLLNQHVAIERGDGEAIYLVGVDDPHYFGADNLEKAFGGIPDEGVSILLAHSPEIYRRAAYVGCDLMLCGHTHAGQICLPGQFALTLNSSAPRFTGRGSWTFDMMRGYTSAGTGSSVVPARFNCPPEVTLHRLRAA